MTPGNVYDYPQAIWSRFQAPALAGRLQPGPGVVEARTGTPAARSVLELSVRLRDARPSEARFRAYGCPVTIAVGQYLAEQLGASTPMTALDAAAIRTALEIPEEKAHCALMGEDAIRALLKQIEP